MVNVNPFSPEQVFDGTYYTAVSVLYPGIWDDLKPYLARALEEGSSHLWSIDDVFELAVKGEITVYAVIKKGQIIGSFTSSEQYHPSKKVLLILLMSIDKNSEEDWKPLYEVFMQQAKNSGFDMIIGGGRPGWARYLGARVKYMFELDL